MIEASAQGTAAGPDRAADAAWRSGYDRATKSTIMIVDDEPLNIEIVRKDLESAGYRHFLTTSNSVEAVEIIQREKPDLVLLDLRMPDVSGLEILEQVRATKSTQDTPVIILTAVEDPATKHRALDLGATDFLSKPFDRLDLLPRVRNALVVKQHIDEVAASVARLELELRRHESTAEELRKAIDAAEAAERSKSEFLANVSHEIRTPLTAILGFADEIAESVSRPEEVDAINTIKRNGEHLLHVINDVLDLSKIEAGKMTVEGIATSPVGIVEEVASLMQVRAEKQRIKLHVHYAFPLPVTIPTDPTRLRQILMNLIGNGIKFTETGQVSIHVHLDRDAGPKIRFDVVDSGVGMTAAQMDNLFQPFTQADSTTTRKFGGTGLGLCICKRLAEMLGGEIKAVSEVGRGSTFTLSIPTGSLEDVAMRTSLRSRRRSKQPANKGRRAEHRPLDCRVLLAEDGPDNQKLISLFLTKAGMDVTVAENGAIAVDLAREALRQGRPFDVILMDIQMPVMDGYEATRQLRDGGHTGPIIALTAHAMAGTSQKCLEAGCDGYTSKPVSKAALIETIRSHLTRLPSHSC